MKKIKSIRIKEINLIDEFIIMGKCEIVVIRK